MLIIYVDDMLLSGPTEHMSEAWSKLGENIKLAVPPGDDEKTYTFLGCTHTLTEREVNGKKLRCHDTNTYHAMQKMLAKYEVAVYECTGQYPRLYHVPTPLMDEETKTSPYRRPASGEDFVECPSCLHTMSVSEVAQNTHPAGTPRKIQDILPMIKPNKENKNPLGVGDDAGESGDAKCGEEDNWWSGMLTPNIARTMACSARGDSNHQLTEEEESLISKILLTFDSDATADELPLETSTKRMYSMSGVVGLRARGFPLCM